MYLTYSIRLILFRLLQVSQISQLQSIVHANATITIAIGGTIGYLKKGSKASLIGGLLVSGMYLL